MGHLLECHLNTFGKHLLCLHTERRYVPIGFQEVQKLRTVGHPESQHFWILMLLLNYFEYHGGHVMQEHRQFMGTFSWLQIRAIMGRGAISAIYITTYRLEFSLTNNFIGNSNYSTCINNIPCTQVQCVHRCQFKVGHIDIQIGDHLSQKCFLMCFGEFQYGRQDGLLSGTTHFSVGCLYFRPAANQIILMNNYIIEVNRNEF